MPQSRFHLTGNQHGQDLCFRAVFPLSYGPVVGRPESWLLWSDRLWAQGGRFASEPEAVAPDRALRFESHPNNRPSMVGLCASYFRRLPSSYRCCRSSRRPRRLINVRRHAGMATASCRAIISRRITVFQLPPRKLRLRAWRAATSVPGISIQSQVITGTMATGTISAGLAFTAVATMAAASALAGRGRRSGRSGIAADQAIA